MPHTTLHAWLSQITIPSSLHSMLFSSDSEQIAQAITLIFTMYPLSEIAIPFLEVIKTDDSSIELNIAEAFILDSIFQKLEEQADENHMVFSKVLEQSHVSDYLISIEYINLLKNDLLESLAFFFVSL